METLFLWIIIVVFIFAVVRLCSCASPIIDGFKTNRPAATITAIEARTIFLLLVIAMLFTILIYLTLEGTLSVILTFYHSGLLTKKKNSN